MRSFGALHQKLSEDNPETELLGRKTESLPPRRNSLLERKPRLAGHSSLAGPQSFKWAGRNNSRLEFMVRTNQSKDSLNFRHSTKDATLYIKYSKPAQSINLNYLEDDSPLNKSNNKNGQRAIAHWRSKRVSFKSKGSNDPEAHPHSTTSLYWKKAKIPPRIELKFDIKKYESVITPLRKDYSKASQQNRKGLAAKSSYRGDKPEVEEILELQHRQTEPIKREARKKHDRALSSIKEQQKKKGRQPRSFEQSEMRHLQNIFESSHSHHEEMVVLQAARPPQCSKAEHEEVDSKEFSAGYLEVRLFAEGGGTSILSRKSECRVQIASLTKIMTFYVVVKIAQLFRLNLWKEKAIVSKRASGINGTNAQLLYSDILTIHDLLHALMLPSGNDAAIALGEWGGKTIRKFCARAETIYGSTMKTLNFVSKLMVEKKSHLRLFVLHMNRMARALCLRDTFFMNTHGLTNQLAYSSAADVAQLTFIANQEKIFREVVGKREYQCKIFNRTFSCTRTLTWRNSNQLLSYPGFIGGKTGVTPSAGPCLTSLFQLREGEVFVVVVLNVKSMADRFRESIGLIISAVSKIYPERLREVSLALRQKQAGQFSSGNQQENNGEAAEGSDMEGEGDSDSFGGQ